jgi:hypothetical protein
MVWAISGLVTRNKIRKAFTINGTIFQIEF